MFQCHKVRLSKCITYIVGTGRAWSKKAAMVCLSCNNAISSFFSKHLMQSMPKYVKDLNRNDFSWRSLYLGESPSLALSIAR